MYPTKLTTRRQNSRRKNGFTLVEVLLSTSVAAIILVSLSVALSQVLESRVKQQITAEVEQQGMQVVQLITQSIRNSDNINAPSSNTSGSSLSVDVYTISADPTVFSLSSGVIQIQEGAGIPVALTSSPVTASGLTLSNLSQSGTPGTIRLEFTLTYTNPTGRQEYTYQKTFYASASVR